jgi:hypothetical protein
VAGIDENIIDEAAEASVVDEINVIVFAIVYAAAIP